MTSQSLNFFIREFTRYIGVGENVVSKEITECLQTGASKDTSRDDSLKLEIPRLPVDPVNQDLSA